MRACEDVRLFAKVCGGERGCLKYLNGGPLPFVKADWKGSLREVEAKSFVLSIG